MTESDLDGILVHFGNFGKYQKKMYFLVSLVIIFSVFQMSYIFTSRRLKHR